MEQKSFFHRLFGTTPGEGMQPKEAIAYSITGFGQNLICTIIGSYLTVFMTDALGFDIDTKILGTTGVMAVAFLMLFTRIFDALNDPIMGSIVDRTRTKWGKCRPYLKWMAMPIAVLTALCFLPFYSANNTGFLLMGACYVLWSIIYTIADVPYWGLSTAMENDTTKRGKMLTVARLFCTAGAGIVTISIPIITSAVTAKYKGPDGLLIATYAVENAATLRWTYFICALVLVILAVPMFFYGFKHTKERYQTEGEAPSLKHNLGLLLKNKPLMMIVLSGILGSARMVYMYTGGLYFCKYALANEGAYSILTLLVIPGGLVASVLVPYFTKKFGKKSTFIVTHLIGAVAMLGMYIARWETPLGLGISVLAMIIIGIPQGINNIMTYAMIGDTVEYLEWKTGERAEGICFAMQTLINKMGMAVGAFIGVVAYSMAAISPTNPSGSMTPEGLDKLWNMLVLSGVISMVLCVIPLFFYEITEDRQRKYVEEIMARKGESTTEEE